MLAARVATNGPIRHDDGMGNQDSNSGSGDASILVRELTGDPALMRLTPGEVVTLGRAPSNRLVLHDERASRNHAELHQAADGGWLIRDLKSRNGTLVSGDAVTGDRLLVDGDIICIGAVEIQFFVGSPPADATSKERDSGEGRITGEMSAEVEQWHSTIRYRRNRSRLLDDIRASAHTGHKVGQATAELCRLAFALGRAEEIDAAANRALESAMLGSAANRGMVLLPKPGTPRKHRVLATDLHGIAAVPSNLKVAEVPADLIETVLATDEAILAGPETVAGQPPAITIIAPVRSDGKAIGCIYLSSEPTGGNGSPDDLEFVMAVCDAVGQAYNNLSTRETLSFRLANVATENRLLKERLGEETRMVGESPALRKISDQIERVATAKATVLIRGESGAGKELVARSIHESSDRRAGPYVCLNCAALSETLLESELFGHEKGAFTGATEKKAGKFETADTGTLFLDEIGEMSPAIQAKFLRVLEGHAFERVGGSVRIKVDVRVVAATNRQLEDAVASGSFRRDLYFRLRVVEIAVPPLRKRQEDIAPLARHFLERFAREVGRRVEGFTPEAIDAMQAYHWPGNIRELRNCVERAVVLASAAQIGVADLALSTLGPPGDTGKIPVATEQFEPATLAEIERRHILATLESTGGNKTKAARLLGIERSTLDRKLARWANADR